MFHRLLSSWHLDCLPAGRGGREATGGRGSPAEGNPAAGSSKVCGILEYTKVFMDFYRIIWNSMEYLGISVKSDGFLWNALAFHRIP